MSKQKIIAIIIAVILIIAIGIIAIGLINNNNNSNIDNNQYTNISEDTFIGTVISNDKYQVTIVPNEDELIRQSSFEIVNAVISENTKIYLGQSELNIEELFKGDVVKVTFDGKIYEVKPGKIIAQKIEVLEEVQE